MMIKTAFMAAVAGWSVLAGASAFASAASGSESLAARDAAIAQAVRRHLTQDIPNASEQIRVETRGDGVVVLSGEAQTPFTAAKALQDARSVRGVTAVENHLQVIA